MGKTALNKEMKAMTLKIAQVLISELQLEDVTSETFDIDLNLVDELGIDSMELTTVVLVLQDECGVIIDEEDYPDLTNIRLIAEYILKKKKKA
ncbi:MAG: acyl carrier protein [bacterium]|nr:acyl carrier protein [bacterium]